MKVVTSGARYLDIDAYGGCIAYAELLNKMGEPAIAASTAPLNESITPTIRSWGSELVRDYSADQNDTYVIIDLSNPEIFDTFVDQAKVEEIIDHHMEFEAYWHERLGDRAQIEFLGAACTQVFERWKQAGKLSEISETSARLLIAGMLDNTLNFEADITTDRDRSAYKELLQYAHLPADWPAQYFAECQTQIMADLSVSLINDTKTALFPSLDSKVSIGQLVVWDAAKIINSEQTTIVKTMAATGHDWFVNVVSISEGRNYLLTHNDKLRSFLEKTVKAVFDTEGLGVTQRLWLRKEIMKADIDANR